VNAMKKQEELELRKKINRAKKIDNEVIRELSVTEQRIYAEICPNFEVSSSDR
jgi:hypothetical protein